MAMIPQERRQVDRVGGTIHPAGAGCCNGARHPKCNRRAAGDLECRRSKSCWPKKSTARQSLHLRLKGHVARSKRPSPKNWVRASNQKQLPKVDGVGQAAIGKVGLLCRVIAHFVQDFCDWRGRCRDLRAVPLVDCVEEIIGRIIRQPDLALIVLPDQRLGRQIDRQ
jgi:hypothetical protein